MTPEFAKAVDPIFAHALELIDRIDRNMAVDAAREQTKLRNLINRAETKLDRSLEWELARYALVSWIDEQLIRTPWKENTYWGENTLESHYFQSNDRATLFFKRAQEATRHPSKDALEVFYLCVVFGFRGLYVESDQTAALAEQHGLPPNVLGWLDQTAGEIRVAADLPPLVDYEAIPASAPPREAQSLLIGAWLVAAILGAFTMVAAVLSVTSPML